MSIPFWTLLAAVLLPFVWFTFETVYRKRELGVIDANYPRLQEAKLTGIAARAHGASANAFEAIAVYAPAVVAAHLLAPESKIAPVLALIWLTVRVLHGVVYMADIPPARTGLFAVGMAMVVGLFLVGARVI